MRAWLLLLIGGVATDCTREPAMPHDPKSGGNATVFDETKDAFSLPIPELSEEHRRAFFVGNSLFNQNWVSAPASIETRDGLGPLFNARSCSGCHFKDGRGRPPEPGEAMSTMLLRISIANARGVNGEPVPDPVYGDQIQGNALPGVPKEADVHVEYTAVLGAFEDGEQFALQKPEYRLRELGYGPPSPGLLLSPRVAPAMIGLGLLEAVPESVLHRLADPADADRDGISGRVNHVSQVGKPERAIGRFGWKAEQPSVQQQVAGAFAGDMGLTSALFQSENHTVHQAAALEMPNGGTPEVAPELLHAVALYARTLAVPARRNYDDPAVARGEELFAAAGCAACHVPSLRIEPASDLPELGSGEIHPYTDLLLHDLGPGLSDNRPSYEANGEEWRTPPLWGIGLVQKVNGHTRFLHDGRARSLQEAILWHQGEASAARSHFLALKRAERSELLAFLNSL